MIRERVERAAANHDIYKPELARLQQATPPKMVDSAHPRTAASNDLVSARDRRSERRFAGAYDADSRTSKGRFNAVSR